MAYVSRVVDLLDPSLNTFSTPSIDVARACVLRGDLAGVRAIDGSFALVASEGITVRMARSMDRPLRYFLAKRHEGPVLYVADRIDTLYKALVADGGDNLAAQFHPSYTRMAPAHHIVELALVGCPDPSPGYTRFFTPQRESLPGDLDEIGRRYIGALADETAKWLQRIDAHDASQHLDRAFAVEHELDLELIVHAHALVSVNAHASEAHVDHRPLPGDESDGPPKGMGVEARKISSVDHRAPPLMVLFRIVDRRRRSNKAAW